VTEGDRSRGVIKWAAILVAMGIAMILCASWEPVEHDGWGHVMWLRDFYRGPESIWVFFRDSYWGSNPRLGQTLTLVMYAYPIGHAIVTPLALLGLLYLLTAFALGRRPGRDDALAFATVSAIVVACTPEIGQMLFYRPYVGNYTLGLLLNLCWALPYRLYATSPWRARWWLAPVMVVVGGIAGLCNEHTGLAFGFMGVVAIAWFVRRGDRIAVWMIAGLVGLAAGYLALLLAPGQGYRYGGLATKQSTLTMIAERGLAGNLAIVGWPLLYMTAMIPWLALGIASRGGDHGSRRQRLAWLGLVATACIATLALVGSPKVGERLYFASAALGSAALAGWVVTRATAVWPRRISVALAALALGFVGVRCLVSYHAVAALGDARLDAITTAAAGSTVHVQRYPVGPSRWFRGEDFDIASVRDSVTRGYSLRTIVIDP
jgi:hypothetical protein